VLGSMLDISVMFLIVTPNAINILFGWDGLGLVSHLLVFGACMLTVL
jgi:NADH:ubiquinone oxidoreductase subunit 5 (subunit L)/multisubunit Na+/H+ antiporter MnhA subunit